MKNIIQTFLIYFFLNQSVIADDQIKPIIEGNIDAKVKIIVYESLTCSHCANFHKVVYPKLKDEFLAVTLVDTSTETMVKYGLQELVIHDPLYADKNAVVSLSTPKANIYSFGVMSNKKTIAFDPSSGVKELPRVFTMQPEDGIVELASKALTQKAHAEAVAQNLRNL